MSSVALLGAPGAGKGAQAAALPERLGVPAIAVGRPGADVTSAAVAERLREPDASGGFVLTGYPRTAEQVPELDALLADDGRALDHVVTLTFDTKELVRRLARLARDGEGTVDDEEFIRNRQFAYLAQTAPLFALYSRRGLLRSVNGQGEPDQVARRLWAMVGPAPAAVSAT